MNTKRPIKINKKSEPTAKQLWKKFFSPVTIVVCIFLVFNAVYFAQRYYFDHVDRPFVEGTRYVGRFYNSGCVLYDVFICGTSPKRDEYYYETEMSKEEVKRLFSDYEEFNLSDKGELTLSKNGRFVSFDPVYTQFNNKERMERNGYKISGIKNLLTIDKAAYDDYKAKHKN